MCSFRLPFLILLVGARKGGCVLVPSDGKLSNADAYVTEFGQGLWPLVTMSLVL